MRKLEFELGDITPLIACGHYIDKFEDTYYLKILFFNFYLTHYND